MALIKRLPSYFLIVTYIKIMSLADENLRGGDIKNNTACYLK